MDHQMFAQLLGNYGEFVGAIAVVVTLGYLSVQIRQNTASSRTNRVVEAQRHFAQMHQVIASDQGLSRLVALCRNELPEDIAAEDDERILAWVNAVANNYVSIEIAFANGEMDAALHQAYCEDFHRFVQMYPGTLPKLHFIIGHYSISADQLIFAPLFDGTYPAG